MAGHRLGPLAAAAAVAAAVGGTVPVAAEMPHVLRVGTYHGIPGPYTSIQQAVDAARPGDWILVGPGDYHEKGSNDPERPAGVLITTPQIHLRGMDRNAVVVDGTTKGGPGVCDPSPQVQDLGPTDGSGRRVGRNGIEVFEVDGVAIENLTVCNFLSSASGENGNQIWWNGGDGTGSIHLHSLAGQYLTASSTFYQDNSSPMAKYGIFTSNEAGPGIIAHTYASNMGDSAYYIGACSDCNVDLTDAHAQNSALGYSGTNAGGHLLIENSEWDHNKAGIVPNTLNNDDWPSPQDGACPNGSIGPTGTHSCTIIRNNRVHDNNNPDTPQFGIAGAAPVGTGILLTGDRNDTVIDNTVVDNGSWGVVVNDFPDTETPSPTVGTPCHGGLDLSTPAQSLCYYFAFGNEVARNTFQHNGFFGNPGNGDLALFNAPNPQDPSNCFHDNVDTGGTVTSDPPALQQLYGTCGLPNVGGIGPSIVGLICASGPVLTLGPLAPTCPANLPGATYPARTAVHMWPIPFASLPTMPDPCAGVPANPWCSPRAGDVAALVSGLPDTGPPGGSGAAVTLAGVGVLAGAAAARRPWWRQPR